MFRKKSINVLNTLIGINNDRMEGYETASKETKETDLKTLFSMFAQTSEECVRELIIEINKLGGSVIDGTKTTGKFFRVWPEVRAALTRKDRESILISCEYGEGNAVDTYTKEIMNNSEDLSPTQQIMLKAQLESIKSDHDKVKEMRDTHVPYINYY